MPINVGTPLNLKIKMSKINADQVKQIDILLTTTVGNYRIKPNEFEKDYIINFLIANRNERTK